MDTQQIERRTLLLAAAGTAALAPFGRAGAQAVPDATASAATAGSWLQQVKAQHALIAAQLQKIVAEDSTVDVLQADLKRLSYLLTAHSVAEENVIYPALTRKDLAIGASDLYLEQQWQKVWNADIDEMALSSTVSMDDIKQRVTRLQTAILEHAKEHEEGKLYPKLWNAGNSAENAQLTVMFRAAYMMVVPG